MMKILFVCHGNICRSVMAQAVFSDMVQKEGKSGALFVDSAAVSREEVGNTIYPPARRELERRGVPLVPHRARQITREDFREFDRIYYMDESNAWHLSRLAGYDPKKVFPLLPGREVSDPWYTGDFRVAFDDIWEGCQRIWKETVSWKNSWSRC